MQIVILIILEVKMAIEPGEQFNEIIKNNFTEDEERDISSRAHNAAEDDRTDDLIQRNIDDLKKWNDPGRHLALAQQNYNIFTRDCRSHLANNDNTNNVEDALSEYMPKINLHLQNAIRYHNKNKGVKSSDSLRLAAQTSRELHERLVSHLGDEHPLSIAAGFHADAMYQHGFNYFEEH
jgi:hypothetical protein